jgi:hypothetical protein
MWFEWLKYLSSYDFYVVYNIILFNHLFKTKHFLVKIEFLSFLWTTLFYTYVELEINHLFCNKYKFLNLVHHLNFLLKKFLVSTMISYTSGRLKGWQLCLMTYTKWMTWQNIGIFFQYSIICLSRHIIFLHVGILC